MLDDFRKLSRASYVSLATFRKSGIKVATPVWCAASGEALYVFSAGEAGKVKRLRNNNQVQMAVCDMRGNVLGDWLQGTGELVDQDSDIEKALIALRKKYGWQMYLLDVGAKLSGKFHQRAYIRLHLLELPRAS